VTVEVNGDGEAGSVVGERFDGDLDVGSDRPVDSAYLPALGWVGVHDVGGAGPVVNPIRRTVMQRGGAVPSPASVWPRRTPFCHSANRDGSVT
jgi:hypothetical protein